MQKQIAKLEELQNLNYGDQIIMDDPLTKESSPYVFFSKAEDDRFYFKNMAGASLMVNSQNTLDGFNVKIIDKDHPKWDETLFTHGKEVGEMLASFVELD